MNYFPGTTISIGLNTPWSTVQKSSCYLIAIGNYKCATCSVFAFHLREIWLTKKKGKKFIWQKMNTKVYSFSKYRPSVFFHDWYDCIHVQRRGVISIAVTTQLIAVALSISHANRRPFVMRILTRLYTHSEVATTFWSHSFLKENKIGLLAIVLVFVVTRLTRTCSNFVGKI